MTTLAASGDLTYLISSLLNNLESLATTALYAFLVVLVVVTMVRKFSMRAGIGALLAMIVALGLWESRTDLADLFHDEIEQSSRSAGPAGREGGGGL